MAFIQVDKFKKNNLTSAIYARRLAKVFKHLWKLFQNDKTIFVNVLYKLVRCTLRSILKIYQVPSTCCV